MNRRTVGNHLQLDVLKQGAAVTKRAKSPHAKRRLLRACERLESLASCLPQRLFRRLCGVRPLAAVVEEGGKIAGFYKTGAALDVCGKPNRLAALAECRGSGFVGGLMCRVMEFSGYTAFDKKAARRLACGLRVRRVVRGASASLPPLGDHVSSYAVVFEAEGFHFFRVADVSAVEDDFAAHRRARGLPVKGAELRPFGDDYGAVRPLQ